MISTLFFRNRYLLTLSIIILFLAGYAGIENLPRLEDPRITNRNPIIITRMPGASATRVETLVTEKIEDALQEISEIKKLESVSRSGGCVIAIELQDWVGIHQNQGIFSKIRDKLDEIEPDLPPEASKPFFDDRRLPAAFTLIAGVIWDDEKSTPEYGVMNRLAEELKDRLKNLSGTELVRIYGDPTEEITVLLDQEEVTLMALNSVQVADLIAAADVKVPAGVLRGNSTDLLLEVTGELTDVNRVRTIPLVTDHRGLTTSLGNVASVNKEWKTPLEEVGFVNGKKAVLVCARMREEVQVDEWIAKAAFVVEDFGANRAAGITITKVFDQSIYTNERLGELGGNLLAGAVVVTVIVLFTMGWRSALIVGTALPLTAGVSLFLLLISGGALHQIAIYGMIVALGLLIDNAIVVTDEVRKRLREGYSREHAVDSTFRHLFVPLVSSTLTTVLGFTPIFLLPGNVGDFIRAIGGSVISAIVASFIISMTIIASLAGIFIRTKAKDEPIRPWWDKGIYISRLAARTKLSLTSLLKTPWLAVGISLILPFFGFLVFPTLGHEFFPPTDRNMFEMKVWMPPDTSIEKTVLVTRKAEEIIKEYEGVSKVDWMVGNNFPIVYYNQMMIMDFTPNFAQGVVTTVNSDFTKSLIPEIQKRLDSELASAQIVIKQFVQGPPKNADIEYRIFGPSLAKLQDIGEQIRLILQNDPSVSHTQVTLPRGEPKLWFNANEVEAKRAGFTLNELSHQLIANLEGLSEGSVIENLEELDVRVRYGNNIRYSLPAIESINLIPKGRKDWTPLTSLGHVVLKPELGGLTRYNGSRCNIIRGFTKPGTLPIDVTHEVIQRLKISGFTLPEGYTMELGGDAELDQEAMENLAIYAPVLIVLMISTLILSFKSVRMALLLVVVSIMSIGLAFLSTWMISFPISFNTILGTLGLIGVAINDSIVVLAAILANKEARLGKISAIVSEVMGSMRHVLSTTFTTIGGFLPILLFIGGDFWPSLAIVLVGGVAGATLMAVLLIPAGYLLISPYINKEAS